MSKFKHGDIIHKPAHDIFPERIVFVDSEIQPGYYLGILLEDGRGRFYTHTVEHEEGYELAAEGVGAELVEMMNKQARENPPPPPDPDKMKMILEDLEAYGFLK